MFHTEEPQVRVFGVAVQNRTERDLYIPVVLVSLEKLSKGMEIILLQITI